MSKTFFAVLISLSFILPEGYLPLPAAIILVVILILLRVLIVLSTVLIIHFLILRKLYWDFPCVSISGVLSFILGSENQACKQAHEDSDSNSTGGSFQTSCKNADKTVGGYSFFHALRQRVSKSR